KPKRAEIAETVGRILRGEGTRSAGHQSLSDLISHVTRRSAKDVGATASLDSDLNLSSLERVELLGAIEERYQVEVSETRFSDLKTVGDLERLLAGEAPERVRYHYPAWAQRWPATWVRFAVYYLLLRPAVFLLGWPRIRGRENLRGV